jgi:hypothetical protein
LTKASTAGTSSILLLEVPRQATRTSSTRSCGRSMLATDRMSSTLPTLSEYKTCQDLQLAPVGHIRNVLLHTFGGTGQISETLLPFCADLDMVKIQQQISKHQDTLRTLRTSMDHINDQRETQALKVCSTFISSCHPFFFCPVV